MDELETLIVPKELGAWLENRQLGDPDFYFTMIEELFKYWRSYSLDFSLGNFISENKKELIEVILGSREYKIEGPLYYALVKGHEVIDGALKYWNFDPRNNGLFVSAREVGRDMYIKEMSKSGWNKLGIDDSNANFIKEEDS